ncbi:MAG: hypothetical protein KIT16_01180 [Rhodospirillaceae bacterium]|nr:hypothetical protein [Rhodospirillaceae bacterium]
MKKLATLAAAALALGLAGTASAATPALDIGPQIDTKASEAAPVGYYWYYRQGWRGRCFYKYVYVSNGYRYAYRWRRTCY